MIPEKLDLSADEMRRLGYQTVDMLVDYFARTREHPTAQRRTRAAMEALFREAPPEQPQDPAAVLERVRRDVFSTAGNVAHPLFFAFVPSPSNFVSVLADAIVSGFNPFSGTWIEAPGPALIELTTIDWLRQAIGLPPEAGGLFVSGGSMANLTALCVARHTRLGEDMRDAVVYFSDQTHSSLARGLRVLGFASAQLRRIESDADYRMPLAALLHAIRADRAVGRRPFCVVANAGTTNTGAVDPLVPLADLCRDEGLWLHADGAYGAAAAVCPTAGVLLRGLERVDSLAIDPHKWLFQPYEIGCAICRDMRLMRDTFAVRPEYMKDIDAAAEELNFCDYGVQLTRAFRALKLWMTVQVFGMRAIRAAIERGIALAEFSERALRESSRADGVEWQVVTPAQLAVITFRAFRTAIDEVALNAWNQRICDEYFARTKAFVLTTVLKGRTVLRLCTNNPRTTEDDLRGVVDELTEIATATRLPN
jgi:glutamate/tyrosine decarboxylase-like PLP-dependent enzyme